MWYTWSDWLLSRKESGNFLLWGWKGQRDKLRWGNISSPFCSPGVRWTIFVYCWRKVKLYTHTPPTFWETGAWPLLGEELFWQVLPTASWRVAWLSTHRRDSRLLACVSSLFMPEPTWRPPTAPEEPEPETYILMIAQVKSEPGVLGKLQWLKQQTWL